MSNDVVTRNDTSSVSKVSLNHIEIESTQSNHGCWNKKKKKIVIGCVIVVLLSISWVGTQQFAQTAVQLASFDAPYFSTWMGTCWMTLCFPIYTIFIALKYRTQSGVAAAFRESCRMFQTPSVTTTQFFTKIFPLNIIWIGTNYMYIFGLKFIAATDASAIFASNVAFVYMLSLCLLHERIYFIRILACLFCISGVVLFAYVEGFGGGSDLLTGILMAIGAAFGAAFYRVVFKVLLGDASLGQVSLFLSLLGICNTIFFWVIFVILYFTGVEYFEAEDIPWSALNASNFLGLVFNFLINFGVAYTYPLFISIALLLGIPLNAVVDIVIKDVSFSLVRLLAAFLVVFGFGIMLLPERWNDPIHRVLLCKCADEEDTGSDNDVEVIKNEEIEEEQL